MFAGANASNAMNGAGKTVLVVEDNELNMMLFNDLLDARGFNVLQARNGTEGWRMAQDHRPDLVLMDIQLPDISGLEVIKWLKEDDYLTSIPVIAVTAFAMVGDKEKYLEAGCDAYISKPISVPEFVQTDECLVAEQKPEPAESQLKTA